VPVPTTGASIGGQIAMRPVIGRCVCLGVLCLSALGLTHAEALAEDRDEGAAPDESSAVEMEGEFYAGKNGYRHGGLSVSAPINDRQTLEINGHVVREHTGDDVFPSLGMNFEQKFTNGIGLKAYSFGYFPVDDQHAWAVGLRGSRHFELRDKTTISPFFGPVYAQVQALEEATDKPATIEHLMLLGGITFERGKLDLTVFGTQSFFSRDPVGLETHVDLQEMTQFDAYDNNDGFARNSAGTEISYSATDRITLTARYALILFDDGTRNSFAFVPSIKLGPRWKAFVGVQVLRGAGTDQNLVTTGGSFSF
jgi:hypothetical protein